MTKRIRKSRSVRGRGNGDIMQTTRIEVPSRQDDDPPRPPAPKEDEDGGIVVLLGLSRSSAPLMAVLLLLLLATLAGTAESFSSPAFLPSGGGAAGRTQQQRGRRRGGGQRGGLLALVSPPLSNRRVLVEVRRGRGRHLGRPGGGGCCALGSSVPGGDDDDDDDTELDVEPDDVPADWTEQDILAELGDDVAGGVGAGANVDDDEDDDDVAVVVDDDDDDEDEDDFVASAVDDEAGGVRKKKRRGADDDDDDDDDDIDIDDLEMELDDDDDDDDDEDIAEEFVGDEGLLVESYRADDVDGVGWEDEDDAVLVVGRSDGEEEWEEDDDEDEEEEEEEEEDALVDDPDDPNYMRQKEIVESAIAASERRARSESFDPLEYISREVTAAQREKIDQLPFFKQVEEMTRNFELTASDVEGSGSGDGPFDLEREVAEVSDLMDDDPYPRHEPGEENLLEQAIGLSDDDMESLDDAYKEINRITSEEPWDKVMVKEQTTDWDSLPTETLEEMEAALDELGGSAYNVTRWLLYDLDFNVTNLILSAVKHNRNAPILLQHWYPQLVSYERYKHARDRNFDFTWEDVENADLSELERYYAGFGYDQIPSKAPAETGIISFEELDEEEIKMAAFENWMTEVYNPEWDRTDFDDDDMRDEDNVFSEFYDAPQHPDLPTLEDAEEDIQEWREDLEDAGDDDDDPAIQAYRDMMGQTFEYEVEKDEEFERDFRGHLIVACSGRPQDLDVAEKITTRFEEEFGKQVYVETRVMALAREEDNVFEIWLESYDIDLLHSKKRATSNTEDWQGPAECSDEQIDHLVSRVRFLISDDARYSYRMDIHE